MVEHRVPAGGVLIQQGEKGRNFYVVERGECDAYVARTFHEASTKLPRTFHRRVRRVRQRGPLPPLRARSRELKPTHLSITRPSPASPRQASIHMCVFTCEYILYIRLSVPGGALPRLPGRQRSPSTNEPSTNLPRTFHQAAWQAALGRRGRRSFSRRSAPAATRRARRRRWT